MFGKMKEEGWQLAEFLFCTPERLGAMSFSVTYLDFRVQLKASFDISITHGNNFRSD